MKKVKEGGSVSGGETRISHRLSVEGGSILVIAELPGIDEEMIRLDLDERVLTISVDGRLGIREEIALPWEARLGKKRFRKGVLELVLEKPA